MSKAIIDEITSTRPHVTPLVKLWILRALVALGGQRKFITQKGFDCDELAETLRLERWIDTGISNKFPRNKVRNKLLRRHEVAEQKAAQAKPPKNLANNMKRLAKLANLLPIECRILEFAIIIHNDPVLCDAMERLGNLTNIKLYQTLATLLRLPESSVRNALCSKGSLTKTGLLRIEHNINALHNKLDLITDNFTYAIFSDDLDPIQLLNDMIRTSPPAQLTLDDYRHIQKPLDALTLYLNTSINTGRCGVNIYLHGAPGTGKSQLARVLAQVAGCELYEISNQDEDGDPISGKTRLRSYRASQSLFAQKKTLILFDEVEDIFHDGSFWGGKKSTAESNKAWINQMLENNPVPTLWLSNSLDGLDQAFIRRFDMVVELPVPSKVRRREIIEQHCSAFLNEHEIKQVAEAENLSPAVISHVSDVVNSIKTELGPENIGSTFQMITSSILQAQGHPRLKMNSAEQFASIYCEKLINTAEDIQVMTQGLKHAQAGRLCFYGPPGTGKTAYGSWLADQLDIPLILKKGSDLISMWVGGTEANIAKAFKEAETEGALLMIDEVDSFLQDRRQAQHSWELTAVNEMLTQMESYSGVFIASTNLMANLDQASLRRFDHKIKFDFLRHEQAFTLLSRYCELLQLDPPSAKHQLELTFHNNCTPGDFAAIARRHRFNPIKSADDFLSALRQECSLKEGTKNRIGFV